LKHIFQKILVGKNKKEPGDMHILKSDIFVLCT